MKTSLITVVTDQDHMLDRQALLIEQSAAKPDEWIVVSVTDERLSVDSPVQLHLRQIASKSRQAIAAAYAEGVRHSIGARLCFVSGACVPLGDVFQAFDVALGQTDAVWSCRARSFASSDPTPLETLDQLQLLHRGSVSEMPKLVDAAWRFRSDCFAISRTNYRAIGGFDPTFSGWDTEDVDFALTAQREGIPLGVIDVDAFVLKRDLPRDPDSIAGVVRTARAFRSKWGVWPKLTMLRTLALHGFIEFNAARDHLRLLRLPTVSELRSLFGRTASSP